MKLLLQTFGWVLVLLGVAAPPALIYLYYERPVAIETYRSTYRDFSSLEESEQERLLKHLDFLIASRAKANQAMAGKVMKDALAPLFEGGAK